MHILHLLYDIIYGVVSCDSYFSGQLRHLGPECAQEVGLVLQIQK